MDIDEKVTCQVNKDGDIEKFELKGTVYLTLTDNKKSHAYVPMQYFDFKGLTFKVHPEIDKQEWNKNKVI
jgi:coatomer subunit delta